MHRSNTERLKQIQAALHVEPDGVLGAQTLSALEKKLGISPTAVAEPVAPAADSGDQAGFLTLSQTGIDAIVRFEIGSEAYYEQALSHPIWPGGDSGVTIGIGYDLAFVAAQAFVSAWGEHLPQRDLERLTEVLGLHGRSAKRACRRLRHIRIDLAAASRVFSRVSLPQYARKALRAYPGLERLLPDAQAAIVSLVYNRGAGMSGSSRSEMRALQPLVLDADYPAIAGQIESMKRLWQGRGLDGLLKRRDEEAALVRQAQRTYSNAERVLIATA